MLVRSHVLGRITVPPDSQSVILGQFFYKSLGQFSSSAKFFCFSQVSEPNTHFFLNVPDTLFLEHIAIITIRIQIINSFKGLGILVTHVSNVLHVEGFNRSEERVLHG